MKLLKSDVDLIISKLKNQHRDAEKKEREDFKLSPKALAECKKMAKILFEAPAWVKEDLVYTAKHGTHEEVLASLIRNRRASDFVSKLPQIKSDLDLRIEIQFAAKTGDYKNIADLLKAVDIYQPKTAK